MYFGWWLWSVQQSVPTGWSIDAGKDLGRQTKSAVPWKPRGERSAVSGKEEGQMTWRLTGDSDGLPSANLCPRDVGEGPGRGEKDCAVCSGQLKFKARMVSRHRFVWYFPAGKDSMSRRLEFSRSRHFLVETLQKGTRLEGAEGSRLRKHGPWVQTG